MNGTGYLSLAACVLFSCAPAAPELLELPADLEALTEDLGAHGLPQRVKHKRTGLVLLLVPAGKYMRGTLDSEPERDSDETLFQVTIPRAFYMGETEVTVAAWMALMEELPDESQEGPEFPVGGVSWYQAAEFIAELNSVDGNVWALPTESEWEYCCRAGTTTTFSFGDSITTDQVNYDGLVPYNKGPKGLRRDSPLEVRSLPPNPWGFYEIHGNLFEWCVDPYVFTVDTKQPLSTPSKGQSRSMRGGSFESGGDLIRSGYRDGYPPNSSAAKYSFRVLRRLGS